MPATFRAFLFFLAAFTGGAFSQAQQPATDPNPPAAAEAIKKSFYNTVWKSTNLKTKFVQYLILKPAGTVGYSDTKTKTDFTFDGDDIWKIEDGHLLIVWTDGFATEKYPLKGMAGKEMEGEKTSKKFGGTAEVILTRITDE